jgi:acid phosphatase type 7
MPSPTNPMAKPAKHPWWSLDVGPVHFLIYSSEHDFTTSSEQYAWMKADLLAVDREKTPWIVCCAHRPFYTSTVGESDVIMGQHLQQELEPLFIAAKVDVVMSGHQVRFAFIAVAPCLAFIHMLLTLSLPIYPTP